MFVVIQDLLDAQNCAATSAAVAAAPFADGKATAGHARSVKENLQINSGDPLVREMLLKLTESIFRHPFFERVVRPSRAPLITINRYDVGMSYGSHVDSPIMGRVRADLSFTIFLSDPASYDGGELIMESPMGNIAYKLPVGAAIIYPSNTLHRVQPVTRGSRLAAVGWAQSTVRDPAKRELLLDLDQAIGVLFEQQGKTPLFDSFVKSASNLLRMWAEL